MSGVERRTHTTEYGTKLQQCWISHNKILSTFFFNIMHEPSALDAMQNIKISLHISLCNSHVKTHSNDLNLNRCTTLGYMVENGTLSLAHGLKMMENEPLAIFSRCYSFSVPCFLSVILSACMVRSIRRFAS